MRRAGTFVGEALEIRPDGTRENAVGFVPYTPVPLPSIDDAGLAHVLARSPSDPHVDIIVMHRHRCGHCKPELQRVANYVADPARDASGWAVEIDEDSNIDRLRDLLLDDDWASPATGYFRGGRLVLSSPTRKESVDTHVRAARSLALGTTAAGAPSSAAPAHPARRLRIRLTVAV